MVVLGKEGWPYPVRSPSRRPDPNQVSGAVEKGGRVNGILAVSRAFGDIEYKGLKEDAWGTPFSADLVIAAPPS